MNKVLNLKTAQAATCLLSGILVWFCYSPLEGTEFSGGSLTARLLQLNGIGAMLFIVAAMLTFFYPRLSATGAILGSLACLPLWMYFTLPAAFRSLFKGTYSVPLQASVVWNGRAIVEIVLFCITILLCTWRASVGRSHRQTST